MKVNLLKSIFQICLNQDWAVPEITHCFKLSDKKLWSTMSKAAERSSNTKIVSLLSSIALRTSFWRRVNIVSVLWCFRYTVWCFSYSWCYERWSCSCLATILSSNFETNVRLDTGRNFFNDSGSNKAFFSNGVIAAGFCEEGNFPVARKKLTIRVITGDKISTFVFKNCLGSGSSTHDVVGEHIIVLHISSIVTGQKFCVFTLGGW